MEGGDGVVKSEDVAMRDVGVTVKDASVATKGENDSTKDVNVVKNVGAPAKKKKMRRGGWNLLILGVLSVVIAMTTTGISLAIYHNSGDIYLDRSRPGYLPEESEIEEESKEKESEYVFEKTGKINREAIEEYLENLDKEVKAIDAYEKPFGAEALSDERLGIPVGGDDTGGDEL